MNTSKPHENVGVVWYTEEEWGKMKNLCADKDHFEETYEEWAAMATRALADMKKAGLMGKKVFVGADEFKNWCAAYSLPLTASSRSEYVLEKSVGAER